MKKIYLVLLTLLLTITAKSQDDIIYAKQIGSSEYDTDMKHTADAFGNSIVANTIMNSFPLNICDSTYTTAGQWSSIITKLDAAGEIIWNKIIESDSGAYNQVTAITTDSDGNIFLGGYYSSGDSYFENDTLQLIGNLDSYLIKLNPQGDFLWKHLFNNSVGDRRQVNAITADNLNNVIVGGIYQGTISLGGTSYSTTGNSANYNVFIGKFNSNGVLTNETEFGSPLAGTEFLIELYCDSLNNIYAGGQYSNSVQLPLDSTSTEGSGGFIVKFDENLNCQIGQIIKSANQFYFGGFSISGDNIYIAGGISDTLFIANNFYVPIGTGYKAYIINLSTSDLSTNWVKMYGQNSHILADIITTRANKTYTILNFRDTIIIENDTYISNGDRDLLLMEISSTGATTWTKRISTVGEQYGGFLSTENNNIYLNFSDESTTVSFNNHTFNGFGSDDIYFLKLGSTSLAEITEPNLFELNIYPNPTNGIFKVKASEEIKQINIYDQVGRLVLSTNEFTIDLTLFPPAIYIVEVKSNSNIKTQKIIKY